MARQQILGYNTRTSIIPETTYGTNPGTGGQELFVQSYQIEHTRNQSPVNFLTKGSAGTVKQGNEATNVTLSGILPKSSTAFHGLLNRFFSLGTTTGSGPYTHPYTMPYATTPGSFTFEVIPQGENSSTRAMQVYGCVPQRLSLSAQPGEHPTYEMFCIGRELAQATGPSSAPSSAIDTEIFTVGDMALTSLPSTQGDGLLLTDTGSNGYYVLPTAFDLEITVGLDEEAYTLDSNQRRQIQRGANMEVSGSITFIYEDGESWDSLDFLSQVRQGTHFTSQFAYNTGTGTGQRRFDIDLGTGSAGAMVFDEAAVPATIEGPGRIEIEAPFTCVNVEDNLALTVINEKAGGTVNI